MCGGWSPVPVRVQRESRSKSRNRKRREANGLVVDSYGATVYIIMSKRSVGTNCCLAPPIRRSAQIVEFGLCERGFTVTTTGTAVRKDVSLLGHLMRRAGFGAPASELERLAERGYEAVVDDLVHPERFPEPDMRLFDRFHPERAQGQGGTQAVPWIYRMLNTQRPLQEKTALLWHGLFATGSAKVNSPPMIPAQCEVLYTHALANFERLLQLISRDPSMLFWLDQQTNHCTAVNENYGRELLELFSVGIGSYDEEDVRSAALAFTGWTITQCVPRSSWNVWFLPEFSYRDDDHDHSEKEFLGERGDFNGDDIIHIIVKQRAHALFVASKLYTFFVSDTPSHDHVEYLADVYEQSGGEVRETVRALFLSDFFKSARATKVRSPVELAVSTLKLSGECTDPYEWDGLHRVPKLIAAMGQQIYNPPTVEGWHTGREWVNTASLVARVNFASERLSNPEAPGIHAIIDRIARTHDSVGGEELLDAVLYELGAIELRDRTRTILVEELETDTPVKCDPAAEPFVEAVTDALRLIAATPEFQLG